MEHWKLPELRPVVGYQPYYPGDVPFQHSAVPAQGHTPVPTPTPDSAACANAKANTSSAFFSKSNRRLKKIKKNYQAVKCRFQARLDKQERKNRALSARLDELKQCEAFLPSLQEIESRVKFAEDYGKFLEWSVQGSESAVQRFNLEEGVKEEEEEEDEEGEEGEDADEDEEDGEGGEDGEDEEGYEWQVRSDSEEEDEGGSEEGEVDAMETENLEHESEEEKDMESICSDALWDD